MREPLITRNYTIFLISIASIVIAVPFVERKDWLGWTATFLSVAATVTIIGLYSRALVQRLVDLWRDDL